MALDSGVTARESACYRWRMKTNLVCQKTKSARSTQVDGFTDLDRLFDQIDTRFVLQIGGAAHGSFQANAQ